MLCLNSKTQHYNKLMLPVNKSRNRKLEIQCHIHVATFQLYIQALTTIYIYPACITQKHSAKSRLGMEFA
ncbi:hypothetical protein Hdeb2414_s0020g00564301 [Helianthus debilis subsp. tardiflorus]